MASLDTLPAYPRTPDGEQVLVYPWQTPDARKALLNRMARAGSETSLLRDLAAKIVVPLGPEPTDAAILQACLDAIFDLVVYRPDPASDQDFYQPIEVTLHPVPGNPRSRLTGEPRGGGDCEDTALLFTALVLAVSAVLRRPMGARVEWLSQPGKPQNHVAPTAWGADGVARWAETTLPGARVGEHPYAALERLGNAHRIEGTYLPVNSGTSGALGAPVAWRDAHGSQVQVDAVAFARGGVVTALVFPRLGLPYRTTLHLESP